MTRRTPLVLAVCVAALLATASVASASTLTRSTTTITFTAATGIDNDIDVNESPAGTLNVNTSDDPVTALPADCTDTDATPGSLPAESFSCTGVEDFETFVLDGADGVTGDDDVTTIALHFFGGEGNDDFYGGRGNDTADGGPGDDNNLRGDRGDDTMTGGTGSDRVTGGPGDDTLTGDDGNDNVNGGPGADNVTGGEGNDDLSGCDNSCSDDPLSMQFDENDVVDGGPGDDDVDGSHGDDTLTGGPGDDDLRGQPGNDSVDGGEGDEGDVVGGPGDDVINAGPGDDEDVFGGPGNDIVNGGAGNDEVSGGCFGECRNPNGPDGTDVVDGGDGFDLLVYTSYYFDDAESEYVGLFPNITLDNAANDGTAGENDNYLNVDDVDVNAIDDAAGGATVTGNAGINSITTDEGADTVDGAGGNDFVFTGSGDDTVNARDGFADRVDCGADTDTANVDQFDQVANCETTNVAQVGNAADDAPPTVAWLTPAADGGTLANGTLLQASASDNQQVTQVVLMSGNRVLCVDTAAPYECAYSKTGADVGNATLVAIAFDNLQQTATAMRFVDVTRFKPSLTTKVSPKSDTSFPLKFRASGKLGLPAGVSDEEGCDGRVTTRWKVGKKTISTRSAKVKDDCTWSVRNSFAEKQRIVADQIRVFARFQGNDVLKGRKGKTRKVDVD